MNKKSGKVRAAVERKGRPGLHWHTGIMDLNGKLVGALLQIVLNTLCYLVGKLICFCFKVSAKQGVRNAGDAPEEGREFLIKF